MREFTIFCTLLVVFHAGAAGVLWADGGTVDAPAATTAVLEAGAMGPVTALDREPGRIVAPWAVVERLNTGFGPALATEHRGRRSYARAAPTPCMTPEEVEARIEAEMPDCKATVEPARGAHEDDHLEATVVSPAFEGESLVDQHEAVYDALGEAMTTDIHALELTTRTPSGRSA